MPRYAMCQDCGHMIERYAPMVCAECGWAPKVEQDFSYPAPHVPEVYDKPIEMYSVAPETPEQLADLREKVPDLEVNDLLVPIARDRPQKKRILKAAGYEEKS